jgi:hypothetical protein
MDSRRWVADCGLRTWTVDSGQWTMDKDMDMDVVMDFVKDLNAKHEHMDTTIVLSKIQCNGETLPQRY